MRVIKDMNNYVPVDCSAYKGFPHISAYGVYTIHCNIFMVVFDAQY